MLFLQLLRMQEYGVMMIKTASVEYDHTGTNWDGAYIQAENDGIAQADLTFGSAVNNSLSQHMIIEGNTGNVGIGTSTTIEGRVDVKMNMASINWTEGNWSEVWDSAGTPGTYFDDAVFHIDTERNRGCNWWNSRVSIFSRMARSSKLGYIFF